MLITGPLSVPHFLLEPRGVAPRPWGNQWVPPATLFPPAPTEVATLVPPARVGSPKLCKPLEAGYHIGSPKQFWFPEAVLAQIIFLQICCRPIVFAQIVYASVFCTNFRCPNLFRPTNVSNMIKKQTCPNIKHMLKNVFNNKNV